METEASTSVPLSILVVSSWPDDRASTDTLRLLTRELEGRPDVAVSTWFLRAAPEQERWPGSRVIDDLRRWPPARALELLGVPRVPDALRGLRLRAWSRRAAPDVVLLDDGLGSRALTGVRRDAVVVVRRNEEAPLYAEWESGPDREVRIVVLAPGEEPAQPADVSSRPVELASAHLRDYSRFRALADEAARHASLAALGVPTGVPLVVGWGSDGWIDGPDVFVRALWALEARHGVRAHGLWLGLGVDPHEVSMLRAEAERCGVGDRFHVRHDNSEALRCAGDVVFLPYRSAGDPAEVIGAVASGLRVVTFPANAVAERGVDVVAHLDVDAAADALAAGLRGDRAAAIADFAVRNDVGTWADQLLVTIAKVSNA